MVAWISWSLAVELCAPLQSVPTRPDKAREVTGISPSSAQPSLAGSWPQIVFLMELPAWVAQTIQTLGEVSSL